MKKTIELCDICNKELNDISYSVEVVERDHQDGEGVVIIDKVACSAKCLKEGIEKGGIGPKP